ncbi:TPA: phage tail spike protein [Streptococcus suis]
MIYLFDKDEKLIKIVRKSAVKTALQKYALTTERYVSDRLTVELKGLNADELEQVEYMAIQTMEDAHIFHYFYVAQKSSDELTTLIGVQSGIEELRKSPVYDKRPQNTFARDVITDLLAGTNWQARFVGETTPHSTNFYYTSVFEALKKVCEVWDLEMQFFVEMNGNRIGGRYIDFKQRIGEAVGKRVVYGHNALQILQEVERTNIFTALIGRGKGEETGDGYGRKITFENVVWSRTQGKPVDKPKGQKYLELPLMTRQYGIKNADGTMRPKIGFVDFSEEENPEVLIERTYKALIDAARPQLTLKTSSVYLRGVKVGDTIRVVRHDKKLDYDTRIFEITFNRLNNQSSDIKLGDRIGESNEAKVQTIADKAVEQFVNNEFSNFVQNLPDYLPSADGFNNNWYGAEDPTVKYPGKVLINDIWFKPDPEHEGHKIMLRWAGEVWEEILRTYDSEALRDRIAEEIAQVTQSMQAQSEEHDRQVADILTKAQSVESLANQAKTDATSAIAQALLSKDEAVADARAQVATVSQALNTAKFELQSAIASADQKARDSQASATALRNDLNLQASKILEQAQAQTDLTNRVSTVETLADGTRSTVAELSKTVAKATGDITSVTSRTKAIEDTLSQTRTQYEALTQTVNAQTGQIDSINRKAADLQSGIDGVTERFERLRIEDNLLLNSSFNENLNQWQGTGVTIVDGKARITGEFNKTKYVYQSIRSQIANDDISQVYIASISVKVTNYVAGSSNPFFRLYVEGRKNDSVSTWFGGTYFTPSDLSTVTDKGTVQFATTFRINVPRNQMNYTSFYIYARDFTGEVEFEKVSLRRGNIDLGWQASPEDLRSEIATYKRTAEESSAELSRQIQLADGKAVEAKTYAQQTAEGFKTRLESLETYKDGESTRASQYFTASRDETARQISALRTAVTDSYVAKAKYEEDARGVTQRFESLQVGGRNYIRNFGFTDSSYTLNNNNSQWRYERIADPTSRSGYHIKATCTQAGSGGFHRLFVDLRGAHWQGRTMTYAVDVKCSRAVTIIIGAEAIESGIKNQSVSTEWQRFAVTGKVKYISTWSFVFYIRNTQWQVGDVVYIRDPQLEDGTMATTPSPAPEDQQSYADTKIAEYKNTVDGRFATLQSQKANQVDLQTVRETVNLYERIIGSTEAGIKDKVARMVMTDSLFLTEVKDKISGTATQVSQLASSWAVKNLTNSGTVLNQLNLNKDGSVKIDGKLVQITGTTYIQDGVITSAKIAGLDAGKITTGTLDAARIAVNSIDGSKMVFDQAFVNKMTANEAYLKQIFAKNAFITQVQAVTLSADKISGGILSAMNDAMKMDLNTGSVNFFTDSPAIRRSVANLPNQFVKFATATEANDNSFKVLSNGLKTTGQASVTSIGTNRANGEKVNDGAFTGINIYASGPATGTRVVDRIGIHSDVLIVSHSVSEGQRGWVYENYNSSNNDFALRPLMPRGLSNYSSYIGTETHPITRLYSDDVMLNGHRLKGILKDLANRVGKYDGWAASIS